MDDPLLSSTGAACDSDLLALLDIGVGFNCGDLLTLDGTPHDDLAFPDGPPPNDDDLAFPYGPPPPPADLASPYGPPPNNDDLAFPYEGRLEVSGLQL